RVEHHLQQDVAELVPQTGGVALVDGLERLVGLLEEVPAQRPVGLLAVPRAPVGTPEAVHHGHEVEQLGARHPAAILGGPDWPGPLRATTLGRPAKGDCPMVKEFRDFVTRGNLIELAVALILALAFAAVVAAFTNVVLSFVA